MMRFGDSCSTLAELPLRFPQRLDCKDIPLNLHIRMMEDAMQISRPALQEVEEALRKYEQEVGASNMTASTKRTYLLHSNNFVRWLKDDFVPGGQKE